MYALIDSGSSISVIDKSLIDLNDLCKQSNDIAVTGITGNRLNILGSIWVDVEIGSYRDRLLVYVSENLNNNILILGRDFLTNQEVVLDYRNLQIKIKDHQHRPLLKVRSSPYSQPLSLNACRTVVLQPHDSQFVKCDVKLGRSKGSRRIFLSTSGVVESRLKGDHVVCEDSLVNVRNGRTHVNLINRTGRQVVFKRNQVLAALETFSGDEIKSLNVNSIGNVCENARDNNACTANKWHDQHDLLEGGFNTCTDKTCHEQLNLMEGSVNACTDKVGHDTATSSVHTSVDKSPHSPGTVRWANIEQLNSILGLNELDDLSEEERGEIRDLISEYRDVFSESNSDLGTTDLDTQTITLADQSPVRSPYYNIPLHLRPHAESAIKQLLDLGVIEPSESDFHSPSFLLKKPDGSYRVLTDFRLLNKKVVRSYQPLQGVNEMLSTWSGCNYYSKLDFRKGFYQIPLHKDSRKYTATSIPGCMFFQYKVLPLGLSSSPTFFQSIVERIFMGMKNTVVAVYMDDILSGSPSVKGMINNLRQVFDRIRDSKMLLSPEKCELFRRELKFLGFRISGAGIAVCPEKVAAIAEMAAPGNIKGVRSFLGVSNFFRKFIEGYGKIVEPLTRLTKKSAQFVWGPEQHEAWSTIKTKLTNSPVLAHPNLAKRFTLITDASDYCIGGILAQANESGQLHPISYGSAILSHNERNWTILQKELFAMMSFMSKWESFLLGAQFDVIVDNTALLHLDKFKDIKSNRLWRWFEKLQKFDFVVTYTPSKSNPSDSLSRLPMSSDKLFDTLPSNSETVTMPTATKSPVVAEPSADIPSGNSLQINSIDVPQDDNMIVSLGHGTLKDALANDADLTVVRSWIENSSRPNKSSDLSPSLSTYYHSFDRLKIDNNGVVLRRWESTRKNESSRWLICVPKSLQTKVIELSHNLPSSGHLGLIKTLERVRSRFYFPKMYTLIQLFTNACLVCHKKNKQHTTIKAPITPQSGKEPGHVVHMDLMEALPKSNGYHAILVVIDSFTKWTECVPLRNTKAETVARAFLNTWISRQGVPCQLHTDRGGNVDTANIIKELVKMLNITKTRNLSYRPQSNAQAERAIGTIKSMLWKFCQENPKNWITVIDQVMFGYRTSINATTNYSPFFLDKGRHPRFPLDLALGVEISSVMGDTYSECAFSLYHKLQNAYQFVHQNIKARQDYNKKRYDEKSHIRLYNVGDWVYVWKPAPAYCNHRVFYDHFRGPFKIVEKVTDFSYKIELRKDRFDIVHMEHLKIGEMPQENTLVELEGYDPDPVPESPQDQVEPTGVDNDPDQGSAYEVSPEPPGNEDQVESSSSKRKVKKKSPPVVIITQTDNDDGEGRRGTRTRRQFIPYQHRG